MSVEEAFTIPYDRIHRRSGHIAVAYKNCVLVWGGYTFQEHVQATSTSPIRTEYFPNDELWIYDCDTELWWRQVTRGECPPRNSGCCAIIHNHNLYIFGGYMSAHEGDYGCNTNGLYRLDLTCFTWQQLHPQGEPKPAPCDKLVGWEYKEKLYFFGGFGPVPPPGVPFDHVIDPSTATDYTRGWSNQLACYCPNTDSWQWPKTRGPMPKPRAAHAADRVGSRLYVFGGRFQGRRMCDLHCLDLDTMTWSGDLNSNIQGAKPAGRSWHSLTFISPRRAIVYGGLNQVNTILNDCWILDTGEQAEEWELSWTELRLPYDYGEPRCWHGAVCAIPGELVIHSGLTQPYYYTYMKLKDHAEELIVMNFSPKSLRRLCVDAVLALSGDKRITSELETLPLSLRALLNQRLAQDAAARKAQEIYYANHEGSAANSS